MSSGSYCLTCEIGLGRALWGSGGAVEPGTGQGHRIAGEASLRRAGAGEGSARDALAVLRDAVQPRAAADTADEVLENPNLTRRIVTSIRPPLRTPEDEVHLRRRLDTNRPGRAIRDSAVVEEVWRTRRAGALAVSRVPERPEHVHPRGSRSRLRGPSR